MKHCRLRPLNSASEPHGTTATAPVAFPATTDPVAFTGSTDPVAVPGTTDTVALPRRRLSVSLNSRNVDQDIFMGFILKGEKFSMITIA